MSETLPFEFNTSPVPSTELIDFYTFAEGVRKAEGIRTLNQDQLEGIHKYYNEPESFRHAEPTPEPYIEEELTITQIANELEQARSAQLKPNVNHKQGRDGTAKFDYFINKLAVKLAQSSNKGVSEEVILRQLLKIDEKIKLSVEEFAQFSDAYYTAKDEQELTAEIAAADEHEGEYEYFYADTDTKDDASTINDGMDEPASLVIDVAEGTDNAIAPEDTSIIAEQQGETSGAAAQTTEETAVNEPAQPDVEAQAAKDEADAAQSQTNQEELGEPAEDTATQTTAAAPEAEKQREANPSHEEINKFFALPEVHRWLVGFKNSVDTYKRHHGGSAEGYLGNGTEQDLPNSYRIFWNDLMEKINEYSEGKNVDVYNELIYQLQNFVYQETNTNVDQVEEQPVKDELPAGSFDDTEVETEEQAEPAAPQAVSADNEDGKVDEPKLIELNITDEKLSEEEPVRKGSALSFEERLQEEVDRKAENIRAYVAEAAVNGVKPLTVLASLYKTDAKRHLLNGIGIREFETQSSMGMALLQEISDVLAEEMGIDETNFSEGNNAQKLGAKLKQTLEAIRPKVGRIERMKRAVGFHGKETSATINNLVTGGLSKTKQKIYKRLGMIH